MSEFVFMLTREDRTIPDAIEVYESIRDTPLAYVGCKDVGIPLNELRALVERVHEDGRPVMLEVVSERRDDELRSAEAALGLGVDYLLGGTHADEVSALIDGAEIAYFPFPGRVVGHPSALRGTIDEIVESASELASRDAVRGLDLLAYRFDGDCERLIERVVECVDVPVVVAGSIDSGVRIRRVSELRPWAFTIGSAVFDRRFVPEGGVRDQVLAALEIARRAAS